MLERIKAAIARDRALTRDARVAQAQELLALLHEAVSKERLLIGASVEGRPALGDVSRAIGLLSVRIRTLTLPPDN